MAKRGRKPGSGKSAAKRTSRRKADADTPLLDDYRHHGATRKNNPPAKIAAEGTVPVIPKAEYAYNPHLPPVLRFDPSGAADVLETRLSAAAEARAAELLAAAQERPLKPEEAAELSKLLATAAHARVAAEPWLEWTGKREQKWFDVDPVALHIHERVSAQAILKVAARQDVQRSLFADPEQEYHEAVQFYRHDVDWANRLILGDSLQVMSSLARREDLAGKVQMIYLDPPYGIKFASNFQPEVGRRDVKEKEQDLTREPEMVRAYRDTWHLGVHSYLTYLRDRLIVARELLADSGSIFVQISDENVHRVRTLMEDVFGVDNFCAEITFSKTSGRTPTLLSSVADYLLWFCRDKGKVKYRQVYEPRPPIENPYERYICVETPNGEIIDLSVAQKMGIAPRPDGRLLRLQQASSQGDSKDSNEPVNFNGRQFIAPRGRHYSVTTSGMQKVANYGRAFAVGTTLTWISYRDEFSYRAINNNWTEGVGASGFGDEKLYVVQTLAGVIQRCLLMTTDPGDLVLDPTCGSGTTAYVAEQWGRRWITIDTSRVAIAIARQRLLTAKYDYYQVKPAPAPTVGAVQHRLDGAAEGSLQSMLPTGPQSPSLGFEYKTVPHIMLKSIAQNVALDPIFAKHEPILDKALAACNAALAKVTDAARVKLCAKLAAKAADEGVRAISDADARRWLVPGTAAKSLRGALEDAFVKSKRNLTRKQKKSFEERIPGVTAEEHGSQSAATPEWRHWEVPFDADDDWPAALRDAVTAYRKAWRAKMDEVNACIAVSAEQEELVDQPDVVRGVTRVSGPFTVEAVQPPEMSLGENIDPHTGRHEGEDEGLFDGEPEELREGFGPRTLRMVERKNELEVANVTAYLEQMFRYLKADGVRFLNNKQARWTRFEPLFESGRAGVFHAEGRWVAGDGEDPDPDGPNNVAVVFGPQYGPVTAKLVEEVIRQANRSGYEQLLIAGFSFDGAATGVLSEGDESGVFHGRGGHRLHVHFAHVRPDINPGMNGLLKESPKPGAGQLFSVFGLPRVRIDEVRGQDAHTTNRVEYVVEMEGVDIYNPVDNSITSTGAEKVSAWFLDGDYDGRTFCITQAFFPDRSAWDKLARALNGKDGPIDAERFEAFSGTRSLPFPLGKHRCVAVKVIDPRGNEVMTVERLA